jgi:hypothetical protein
MGNTQVHTHYCHKYYHYNANYDALDSSGQHQGKMNRQSYALYSLRLLFSRVFTKFSKIHGHIFIAHLF